MSLAMSLVPPAHLQQVAGGHVLVDEEGLHRRVAQRPCEEPCAEGLAGTGLADQTEVPAGGVRLEQLGEEQPVLAVDGRQPQHLRRVVSVRRYWKRLLHPGLRQ